MSVRQQPSSSPFASGSLTKARTPADASATDSSGNDRGSVGERLAFNLVADGEQCWPAALPGLWNIS